ncbi:histidine protein methyltransferase 1 homolog isoform X2 [Copidosoma floridanum]|uniref:histidine protein methyltransferase 1 homolog isoform X2 n=1 Tax=Copidosoma floridanum TaxID=29053 RepID=UPI000C6F70C5|nr:histidine protein methyltransferase 1 homolog isoform X2 [Copidosoma floridanum]
MFKFNFGKQSSDCENKDHSGKKKDELTWLPAKKIEILSDCENVEYLTNERFGQIELKLVDTLVVASKLTTDKCKIISEAESQHSDLIPAKYEGGLKIWECTYDLANYLLKENVPFSGKTVLDLGCGAGVLGLIALAQGSTVDFQDYNAEVIENVTIPNVMINSNRESAEKCSFYCGDWKSFENLISKDSNNKRYDYIFTSETIYNSDNHQKLYNIFKRTLKSDGIGYIAGKSLYFGVGGSMSQFVQLVLEDGIFDVSTVWKSEIGNTNYCQYFYI